jgi:hypothetical protein
MKKEPGSLFQIRSTRAIKWSTIPCQEAEINCDGTEGIKKGEESIHEEGEGGESEKSVRRDRERNCFGMFADKSSKITSFQNDE